MTNILLSTSNLCVSYGDLEVLHDVNINIYKNEWILLIGPNGAGKSTLLKAIRGILKSKGEITYFPDKDSLSLGFLKQSRNIFPGITVKENLDLASFYERKKDKKNFLEFIFHVFPDLEPVLEKRAGLLSGGMRQKLAIGMILSQKNDLILLDEPTAGLAPKSAIEILSKLDILKKEINEEKDLTILMVEHNYKLAIQYINRLIGMKAGKIEVDSKDPVNFFNNRKKMEKIFFEV